jgi:hypothetical protein
MSRLTGGNSAILDRRAIYRSAVTWSEVAAMLGDYAEAIDWLDLAVSIGGTLTPSQRARRWSWRLQARSQGRPAD